MMQPRNVATGIAVVAAMVLGLAPPGLAQRVRDPVLKGNPYRNVGGSCVYGRDGKLVFAPSRARCPAQQGTTADSPEARSSKKSHSPQLRADMRSLLEDHAQVAQKLAELRRAVAKGQKTEALEASEHIARELSEHMVREKRLFEKLSAEHAAGR